MEKLFENQKIIIDSLDKQPFYDREIFKRITLNNQTTGIVGARGIGKTTYLLKQVIAKGAKERQALYITADHVYFLENTLIDLVDKLYKETDVKFLCIDEIHKYPNWDQELKNIADTYREFKILFSGSSMIDLIHGKYDLSRRVTLYTLHGLSFREYLEYYLNVRLPIITFDDLIKKHINFTQALEIPKILKYFKEYLRLGYYPFFKNLETDYEKFQAIENATQKTIYEDIGTLHSLKTPTLSLIEKLFQYVINSVPGELNANKLANTVKKDFDSISQYLKYLEEAGLIRFLFSKKSGKAALRNPIKMYPENCNLMYSGYLSQKEDNAIGKIRESFVINQLQNFGLKVYYGETGDFITNETTLEVGGKNKTNQQIKHQKNAYILSDGILMGTKQRIPLYLLGFLY